MSCVYWTSMKLLFAGSSHCDVMFVPDYSALARAVMLCLGLL
jgi:hypothetical protein